MNQFKLENYLTSGVINIVKDIWKASLKNPKASLFMIQYMKSNSEANRIRKKAADQGEHIPPFLIASITNKCNLHCAGCYARANQSCSDDNNDLANELSANEQRKGLNANEHDIGLSANEQDKLLTLEDWNRIFSEAEALGISFVLLAGGEPMLRTDILELAGAHRKILFPVFTNGTLFTEKTIELIKENPNLLPVLSLEGHIKSTDSRRGPSVYEAIISSMELLKNKGIIFGSSVTVQKNNLEEVMSDSFINALSAKGCSAIVYVEYVPVDKESTGLAPDDQDRAYADHRLTVLRANYPEMLFISFPGNEKASGGCLAAGRGFFHITPYGSAEPCPFSPYSDSNLRELSLKEALSSKLFLVLQDSGALTEDHAGGCVLFEKEEQVKKIMRLPIARRI